MSSDQEVRIAGNLHLWQVMSRLAQERPIFHSEADFQFAIAWLVRELCPALSVRLELRQASDREYLDLLLRDPDGYATAIERSLRGIAKPNVAIVTAYNDMLSAHQPFEQYPRLIKQAVIRAGGIAQVAGGVPAMCDGITQGRDGMQLSLFSRDVIAMATALALSHEMFDAADVRRLGQGAGRHPPHAGGGRRRPTRETA